MGAQEDLNALRTQNNALQPGAISPGLLEQITAGLQRVPGAAQGLATRGAQGIGNALRNDAGIIQDQGLLGYAGQVAAKAGRDTLPTLGALARSGLAGGGASLAGGVASALQGQSDPLGNALFGQPQQAPGLAEQGVVGGAQGAGNAALQQFAQAQQAALQAAQQRGAQGGGLQGGFSTPAPDFDSLRQEAPQNLPSPNFNPIIAALNANRPEEPQGAGVGQRLTQVLGGLAAGAARGSRGRTSGAVGRTLAGAGAGGVGALAGLEQRDAEEATQFRQEQQALDRTIARVQLEEETAKASVNTANATQLSAHRDREQQVDLLKFQATQILQVVPGANGTHVIVGQEDGSRKTQFIPRGPLLTDMIDTMLNAQKLFEGADNITVSLHGQEFLRKNLGIFAQPLRAAMALMKVDQNFEDSIFEEIKERFPEVAASIEMSGGIDEDDLRRHGDKIMDIGMRRIFESKMAFDNGDAEGGQLWETGRTLISQSPFRRFADPNVQESLIRGALSGR